MKIEVIISTYNNTPENIDDSLLDFPNLKIINQVPTRNLGEISKKIIRKNKWYVYDEVGLSKSRNLALKISEGDYIYLSDDDIILEKSFSETVLNAILNNPDIDIFAFQVEGIEKKFKNYEPKEKKINIINSMKLSSVQLIYKTEFIKKNKLLFDEAFGSGSKYSMGEENIFLVDALKSKAKIKYFPKQIAQVHLKDSSWFKGFNSKYFFDRGAINYRMFGYIVGFLMCLIFLIRKYSVYSSNISFFNAFNNMIKGLMDVGKKNEK